jgi:hypothetical protein
MTLEDSMAQMRVLFNLETSDEYKIAASTAAAKHKDARKALIEFAQNEQDSKVRVMAISALAPLAAAEHGDAVDALNTIAKDKNDPLRQFAANALESLAAEHEYVRKALIGIATDLILEILSNPNSDEHKIADLTALAQKDADAREVLIECSQNNMYSSDVRKLAIFALELRAETHEDACNALITAAEKDCFAPIRERAVISLKPLAKTNANARATLITVAKNDGDIDVRKRAIEGLAPLAAEHEDARKALIDIAQWKEKLRNDIWSLWSS